MPATASWDELLDDDPLFEEELVDRRRSEAATSASASATYLHASRQTAARVAGERTLPPEQREQQAARSWLASQISAGWEALVQDEESVAPRSRAARATIGAALYALGDLLAQVRSTLTGNGHILRRPLHGTC